MYCIVLMNLIMSMTLLLSFMYTRSSPEWSPSYTTPATGGDWSTMMGESEIPMVLRSTVNRIKHIIRMVKLSFNNKWSDKTRKYCYSTIMYFKMHSVDCFELVKYWFQHSNCGIKHCINSICVLVNAQTCKCSFHALQFNYNLLQNPCLPLLTALSLIHTGTPLVIWCSSVMLGLKSMGVHINSSQSRVVRPRQKSFLFRPESGSLQSKT